VGYTAQNNGIVVLNRDFEILSRGQAQLFTDSQREDDLAFLGEHGSHVGKSYHDQEEMQPASLRYAGSRPAFRSFAQPRGGEKRFCSATGGAAW
jgi:hypothetical protein